MSRGLFGSFMQGLETTVHGLCPFPMALCPCAFFAEWPFILRNASPFSVSETSLTPSSLRGDNAISVASMLSEGYF